MRLMRVFGNICEMQTECFAQAPKFDFTLMLKAEFEGLLSYLLSMTHLFMLFLTFKLQTKN